MQPLIGHALQFLHPFRLSDRSTKARQNVNMIFDTAYADRWTVQSFRNLTKVRVERHAGFQIAQERPAILRGKNEVNINDRQ